MTAEKIGGRVMETGFEMVSFEIIANAGDARSFAFGALEAAKAGNFEEAEELLKKSDAAAVLAHHAQTDLLVKQANGENVPVDVLMVHSQDHLMTSMLAIEILQPQRRSPLHTFSGGQKVALVRCQHGRNHLKGRCRARL